ncbi:MAG: Ig-like domain repeat protein [Acidimicrobiales bacterium]
MSSSGRHSRHRSVPVRALRAMTSATLVAAAALAAVSLAPRAASASTTITVNTAADSNDGPSACNGADTCSLFDAITAADNGSSTQSSPITIDVPPGTYVIPASNPLPYLDSATAEAIDITGTGSDPSQTVIDGDGTNGSGTSILLDGLAGDEYNTFTNVTFEDGYSDGNGFGGGALNWSQASAANVLTVDDCVFSDNVSQNDGGGAILDFGGTGASLTVTGSTFEGNSAVGITGSTAAGGAIDANVPILTVSDSTFQGNTSGVSSPTNSSPSSLSAQGDGGAVITGWSSPGPSFSITDSDFSGNEAYAGYASVDGSLQAGSGGAVSDFSGPLTVSDSRLAGNVAVSAGDTSQTEDLAFVGGETEGTYGSAVTADEDWWGVNTGPQATAFTSASNVTMSASSWLELEVNAASDDVLESGTTSLQADLFETNNAGTLSGLPGLPGFVDGTIFSAGFGSLSGESSDFVNGDASATFDAPGSPGTATIDTTLDSQTVSTSITVGGPPTVTQNPSSVEVCSGSLAQFNSAASGFPAPSAQWQVSTDGGSTFGPISGATSSDYSFTASDSENGYQYDVVYTNAFPPPATSGPATLTVDDAPLVTANPLSQTVQTGDTVTFTAAASGSPTPTVQWYVEPSGSSTFTPISGATSTTYSFTAGLGDDGSQYEAVFSNTCGPDVPTSAASLSVTGQAPGISSADGTTFLVGQSNSFTVQTNGIPTPAITEVGALPNGVSFLDNGDGTATLSGDPASGTGGSYPITITATNGVNPPATQDFTLVVQESPQITSASTTTFSVGQSGSFAVQTTGSPTPSISESGTLPTGVTFTDDGDGTATIAGTPAPLSGGSYSFTIDAGNGVGSDATQTFTLLVDEVPLITSPEVSVFADGQSGSFTITTAGFPTPAISEAGALPLGVTFTDNGNGTATISALTSVSPHRFHLTITATGDAASVTKPFTVDVVADQPDETLEVGCAVRSPIHDLRLAVAILEAVGGGTINLQPGCAVRVGESGVGLYYTSANGRDATAPITVPITINGGGSNVVLAPGASAMRLFEVASSGSLTLNDVSLTGGDDQSGVGGGAVYNDGTATLTDVTLSGDRAATGSGDAVVNEGTMTIIGGKVVDDRGDLGEAVISGGNLTVSGTTFIHDYSGSILDDGGLLSVTDATFTVDQAFEAISVVLVTGGSATIADSTFTKNESLFGAVTAYGGSVVLVDDTLVENLGYFGAGGVGAIASTLDVTDSTLADNENEGDFYPGSAVSAIGGGTVNLAGDLLATRHPDPYGECGTDGEPASVVLDGGYNYSDDSSCGFTQVTSPVVAGLRHDLGILASNGGPVETVAERTGSPTIGVVPSTATDVNGLELCAGNDARGVPRPQTGCDAGSFQTASTTTTIGDSEPTIVEGSAEVLTATVTPSSSVWEPTAAVEFHRTKNGHTALIGSADLNGSNPDEATLTTTSLPVGTYTVTATFRASNGFFPSISTAVTITVTP